MGQLKNKHTKSSLGPDQSRVLGGWVVYLGLLMSIMLIVPFGLAHGAYTSSDCIKFHSEGSTDSRLHISVEEFRASAHGEEFTCEDCHTDVQGEDHLTRTVSERVDCLQQCYKCHFGSQGQDALWGNIHVKATKEHPSIFAAATIYQLFLVALLWGGFRYYTRKFSQKERG